MEDDAPQNIQHTQLDLGPELTADHNSIYAFIDDLNFIPTPNNSAQSSASAVHLTSATPLTLSTATYINPGLGSLPSTPAAPSNLFSAALPQLPPHPSSAPAPRLLTSTFPSLGGPLLLPPTRAISPDTPPLPHHHVQASPITPMGSPPAPPQSAPCTPANVPLSPLSPLLGSFNAERFVPSSDLSNKLFNRPANEDSTKLFNEMLLEIKSFVDRLKCEKRDKMRENPPHDRNVMSPKERTRIRSRRGAAVSRFRVSRTMEALDEAAVWCVSQIGGSPRPFCIMGPSTPGQSAQGNLSPRLQLASTLITLSIGTPNKGSSSTASSSHLAPPVMQLPPAPVAPEGLVVFPPKMSDDNILRSVTRTPLTNAENKEFVLSEQLQSALRERKGQEEVEDLADRLRLEVGNFVEMKKGLVRDELKNRLNEVRDKLTAKSRMRGRSRRGAAVTRFKNTATIRTWEDALRWLVNEIKAEDGVDRRDDGHVFDHGHYNSLS